METVLRTIYLLFNEGYHSEREDKVIRKELCIEAMKLNYLLLKELVEKGNYHLQKAAESKVTSKYFVKPA